MGAIYRVARGASVDPDRDLLEASYGWGPLHIFLGLLAAEENIPLETMRDYGGSTPWNQAETVLAPLFDLSLLDDDELAVGACREMLPRLLQIRSSWRSGSFSGAEPEGWMRELQLSNFDSLIAVVEACVETGRGMVVR